MLKQFTLSLSLSLSLFPLASELVDWLINSGEAEDRTQAVLLGQLLVDTDYIHHVVDEHNFEDAYLFFRFRQDGKCERGREKEKERGEREKEREGGERKKERGERGGLKKCIIYQCVVKSF